MYVYIELLCIWNAIFENTRMKKADALIYIHIRGPKKYVFFIFYDVEFRGFFLCKL